MSRYQLNEHIPDILKLLNDLGVKEYERLRFFSLMASEAEFHQSVRTLVDDIYSRFFCETAKRKLSIRELVDTIALN